MTSAGLYAVYSTGDAVEVPDYQVSFHMQYAVYSLQVTHALSSL